jgi:spore coat protein CotH
MSTSKQIDRICAIALVVALLLTLVLYNGAALGIQSVTTTTLGYESKLFDTSRVHTIDIVMDDWDGFIEGCEDEEYVLCSVVIDNEAYKNVGIRAKGNTSLSSVSQMNSQRYSFKIEFDHYDDTKSYYGLDKLNLNNLIQDNTMMKDYLCYQLMASFGANAPLCSFVYITVNGEDWGLYLAVEGIEDSFLERNYGSESGDLYKPDGTEMGGGRGNGQDFDMSDLMENGDFDFSSFADSFDRGDSSSSFDASQGFGGGDATQPSGDMGGFGASADSSESDQSSFGDKNSFGGMGNTGGFGDNAMGSDDAKLQYIDDDPDSYSTIFESAKTVVTTADQQRLIAALKSLSEGNVESCLDIDQVLRYFVVHNYVVNGDSYTGSMIHNYYLYEQDGILSMLPWDYNLAFGGFQSSDASAAVNDPIDTPLNVTGDGSRPMIDWIFEDESYTELYHQYFAEFLECVDIQSMIDEASALIAPYVEQDPTKFCTYEEFEVGVSTLKEFCQLRSESIAGQLDGTIPSTSSGQSADSSSLVDCSSLSLTDMGSMNQTMGNLGGGMDQMQTMGGMGGFGGMQGMGNQSGSASDASGDTDTNSDSDSQQPSFGQGFGGAENGQMPDQPDTTDTQTPATADSPTGTQPDSSQAQGDVQMPSGDQTGGDAQMPGGDQTGGDAQMPGGDQTGGDAQMPGNGQAGAGGQMPAMPGGDAATGDDTQAEDQSTPSLPDGSSFAPSAADDSTSDSSSEGDRSTSDSSSNDSDGDGKSSADPGAISPTDPGNGQTPSFSGSGGGFGGSAGSGQSFQLDLSAPILLGGSLLLLLVGLLIAWRYKR